MTTRIGSFTPSVVPSGGPLKTTPRLIGTQNPRLTGTAPAITPGPSFGGGVPTTGTQGGGIPTVSPSQGGLPLTSTANSSPHADLRSKIISGGPSAGLSGINSHLQQLAGSIGSAPSVGGHSINPVAAGEFSASPEAARAREIALRRLEGLDEAPDRLQLADEAFRIFQEQRAPERERRLQDTGRRAAALGRLGAGQTTSELNDVEVALARDEDLLQRSLTNDALSQTMADRFGIFDRSLGASNDFTGQNLADQNFQLALRNEARGEDQRRIDTAFGNDALSLQRYGAGLQGVGTLAGVSGLLGNQERGFRDEQRFERGRLDDLSQQSINNRERQALISDQLSGNAYQRELDRLRLEGSVGLSSAPGANTFLQGSVDSRPSGAGTSALFQEAALRRILDRQRGQAGTSGGIIPTGIEGVGV